MLFRVLSINKYWLKEYMNNERKKVYAIVARISPAFTTSPSFT